MVNLGIKRNRIQKLWLNTYRSASGEPFLKIENAPGGYMTRWRDRTTMKKMEETKRYLETICGYQRG